MSFFKVKNRPVFIVSSMIVLWLIYVNVIQRYSLEKSVRFLNAELNDYVKSRPDDFDKLVLNLSSSRGVWDEKRHRIISLLNPEHCELSYWMRSTGSTSTARINIRLRDFDMDGMTEGASTVEVFLRSNAPSIIVEIQEKDMTVEQCERIDGYYAGGCWYGFEARTVRLYTLNVPDFRRRLTVLIKQCGWWRLPV